MTVYDPQPERLTVRADELVVGDVLDRGEESAVIRIVLEVVDDGGSRRFGIRRLRDGRTAVVRLSESPYATIRIVREARP